MKRKTSNSPYPVLYPTGEEYSAEQGYRQAHFDVAGEPRIGVNTSHNLVIDFDFDLDEETIASLVDSGYAKYYVNVECGHAYFRHAYVQSDKKFHLEIEYGQIADSIDIFVGIVANRDIPEYVAEGFHLIVAFPEEFLLLIVQRLVLLAQSHHIAYACSHHS